MDGQGMTLAWRANTVKCILVATLLNSNLTRASTLNTINLLKTACFLASRDTTRQIQRTNRCCHKVLSFNSLLCVSVNRWTSLMCCQAWNHVKFLRMSNLNTLKRRYRLNPSVTKSKQRMCCRWPSIPKSLRIKELKTAIQTDANAI